MYAASYERRRRAWDFDGNGPGSAIWRSNNGGATFERCEGLPTGDIARIGLDVYAKDPKVVFATISDQNRVEIEREPEKGLVTDFKENQLVVQEVGEGSGAASLGLAANDVLVSYGGEALGNALAWLAVVERHAALEEDSEDPAATLVVTRGEESLEFEASLRPALLGPRTRARDPRGRELRLALRRSRRDVDEGDREVDGHQPAGTTTARSASIRRTRTTSSCATYRSCVRRTAARLSSASRRACTSTTTR